MRIFVEKRYRISIMQTLYQSIMLQPCVETIQIHGDVHQSVMQRSSARTLSSFRSSIFVLLVLVFSGPFASYASAKKKDHNKPHPHRGILKPYTHDSFDSIRLTAKEEDFLSSGHPVMIQTMPDPNNPEAGGGALCIQDIHASKREVWEQILDLEAYHGKVSKVMESKNYYVANNRDGTQTIKTKMVLGVLPGYSYESYYDHTYDPKRDSMTWTLDYDKTSDFDDVSGHWHVASHPRQPDTITRVYYACDIKMSGSVPGPILNYISKAALKQATGWVKRESEKVATERALLEPSQPLPRHALPGLLGGGGRGNRRSLIPSLFRRQ